MNSFLDPVGARPPVTYWRRRALIAAALAVLIMLLVRTCGSAAPDLRSTAGRQGPVPLVSTYTPTPTPTEKIIDGGTDALPGFQSGGGAGSGEAGGIGSGASSTTTAKSAGIGSGSGSGSAGGAAGPAKPIATVSPARTAAPRPASTAASAAGATPKPAPTKQAVPVAVTTCRRSAIAVTLRSDKGAYTAKKAAQLFIAVKNVGDVGCLVDLGSQALSLVVKSGKDRIWSSDDCQGKGTSDVRLLKPGQALEARSVWSTVRSEKGCPKGMAKARPGTYVLEGSAGGVKAKKRAVFRIV
jgi:hypothetical protein